MLSIRNLKIIRSSGKEYKTIIKSGNLNLESGTILDIEGKSGAGKTSILLALARLISVVEGEMYLDGKKHEDIEPEIWRTKISLVPQKSLMISGSVKENLLLPWSFRVRKDIPLPDDNQLREELHAMGLTDVSLENKASCLSVGQMSRIAFLRVLLCNPKVLLLDEVFANLDNASIELVDQKLVKFLEGGNSIIRVQHHNKGIAGDYELTLSDGELL